MYFTEIDHTRQAAGAQGNDDRHFPLVAIATSQFAAGLESTANFVRKVQYRFVYCLSQYAFKHNAFGDSEHCIHVHSRPTLNMSPSDNIEIPLESVKTVSPSPARDALRSNLSAADSEPTQTLKKRKSWMASLRDAVHRGAMQAKSAVDLFRGDQSKAEA
jgi:hypothetical protein